MCLWSEVNKNINYGLFEQVKRGVVGNYNQQHHGGGSGHHGRPPGSSGGGQGNKKMPLNV